MIMSYIWSNNIKPDTTGYQINIYIYILLVINDY